MSVIQMCVAFVCESEKEGKVKSEEGDATIQEERKTKTKKKKPHTLCKLGHSGQTHPKKNELPNC